MVVSRIKRRVIDGETYGLHGEYKSKEEAMKIADKLRSEGYKARIKMLSIPDYGYFHLIYKRKSRAKK
jgi:hypothetical protein